MIHTMDVILKLSPFFYQQILQSFGEPDTITCWETQVFANSGISKLTLFKVVHNHFQACYLRLNINPSFILTGRFDPNALFDEYDFAELIPAFNELVASIIDSHLHSLEYWTASRIDYAADALITGSIQPQQYVELAKLGLLPISSVEASRPGWVSYTAENGSCRVRVYHRGPAVRSNFLGLPDAVYQIADQTLRLEVECHDARLGSIASRKTFPSRQVEHFLSCPDVGWEELSRQSRRIFGVHDYYSLSGSTPRITGSDYLQRTQNDLRVFLKSVQVAGGLQAAQDRWNQGQPIPFRFNKQRSTGRVFSPAQVRRIIRQLRRLHINPVPLPIGWKPGCFPHPFPELF